MCCARTSVAWIVMIDNSVYGVWKESATSQ